MRSLNICMYVYIYIYVCVYFFPQQTSWWPVSVITAILVTAWFCRDVLILNSRLIQWRTVLEKLIVA
jgi:hypothetical protein